MKNVTTKNAEPIIIPINAVELRYTYSTLQTTTIDPGKAKEKQQMKKEVVMQNGNIKVKNNVSAAFSSLFISV